MDYQLDLRAYCCPLPLLMTKKALKTLAVGDSLRIQFNAHSSLADFQQLAERLELKVEQGSENDGFWVQFLVVQGGR